ncbi:PDT-domain-containing protein [Peniophora sp. CONT]|nr:PDT-domain-containing protein [Peniophora sp. CONT]
MAAESNSASRPSGTNGADPLPKLAFLGPIGTYSHQAAYERFGDAVSYEARSTIADAFRSVDESFSLALLPQENSIFGSVVETYDLLRDPSLGHTVWIRGDVVLPVQHSLVVRSGTRLSDIRRVFSHEQALGQCVRFLDAHLPGVKKEAVPSTAGAAETLSKDEDMRDAAAICSKFCTKLFPGLEALHEGIQNESHNFTRFYVLANTQTAALPVTVEPDEYCHALLRLHLSPPIAGKHLKKKELTITDILLEVRLSASRIDRRPSLTRKDEQFKDVYLVEVMADASQYGEGERERRWMIHLRGALLTIQTIGGQGELIGLW